MMVVIPNIMGLVIYQPNLNTHRVSPIAEAFCRQLVKTYRVNLFDQLVFQDKDIVVHEAERKVEESHESLTVKWFDLCMACGVGDFLKVKALVRDGADVNKFDYDKRYGGGGGGALCVCVLA